MTTLKPYINQGPYIVIEETNIFKSYGICNMKLNNPYTNLNKIKIKTNLKKVEKLKSKTRIEVFYNDKSMKKIKILGEGSFGKVFLYQYKNHNIALKVPEKNIDIDYEVEIIEKIIPKKICKDGVIPLKIVNDQSSNPFVVMQVANGNLRDLELLDNRLILKIIFKLAEILICFLEKDIFYLDLKRENILYKCWGNNISIYLGDLGGFFNKEDIIEGGGYFLAPEIIELEEYQIKEEHVIFAFGCFIAELYGYRKDLGFKEGKTKESINNIFYPKFKEKILKDKHIPDNIKVLILLFTEINPNKRKENDINIVLELLK